MGEDESGHLGDDALGRALDRLFDCDRASLMTALVVHAAKTFDIATSEIHNDTTSIKFCGACLQTNGKDGVFSVALRTNRLDIEYNFEIRAAGFLSAYFSVPAPLKEGSNLSIFLERSPMIEGTVFAPDGTPAVGATVVVSTTNDSVHMASPGQLQIYGFHGAEGLRSETDATGHFLVKMNPGAARILVARALGFYEGSLQPLATSNPISLQRWR